MKCDQPNCHNDHAELSRIGGITRRMCFKCTKEMVLVQREKESKNNGTFR